IEQRIPGDALVFGTLGAVGFERLDHGVEAGVEKRIRHVAAVIELCDRQQPAGGSGVAADESQLAILDAGAAPAEILLRLDRLVVLIRAEKGKIEAIARI